MILTTTERITNKSVKEYLGLVTGTDIYLVGGLMGGGLANQEKLFTAAFNNAKGHMTTRATQLGADAVIGINYTVSAPGNTANIIVTVMGTAVKLGEPVDSDELPDLF